MTDMNFKNWLEAKLSTQEGMWMPDSAAEETSGSVRAQAKSKRKAVASGGAGMASGAMPTPAATP